MGEGSPDRRQRDTDRVRPAVRRAAWWAIAAVLILGVLGVFLVSTPAQAADRWTDITDAAWQQTYGLSPAQVATVAQGYSDGAFRPASPVLRAQFAKMALSAFALKTAAPASPTFSDVLPASFYFSWIEGGVAAGIISKADTYRPLAQSTRAEAAAVVAAYLVEKEISKNGAINGNISNYPSLAAWYGAEGDSVLSYFKDKDSVSEADAPATAYLVYHQVIQGSARGGRLYLDPKTTLTRAQAVAFILRSLSTQLRAAVAAPPKITALGPLEGPETGEGKVVIMGSGFREAISVAFGSATVSLAGFTVESDNQITVKAAPAGTGTVDVTVTTPLGRSASGAADHYSYVSALSKGDSVVVEAVKHVGVPYVWAGAGPDGFDCSGFVLYVFGKLGMNLPHSSILQSTAGSAVPPDQLRPGDLLFFYNPVHHVGIYVGGGNMIDAPGTGAFVRIEKVWTSSLTGARRMFPEPVS